jgi:acetyl-CoA carboxylase, biotin carboxylase subunit
MFKRVLIANRGEIAVRIIRACYELGVETIAVYSDADRNALHVRRAHEAFHLGPAPSRDSYLRIDRIIDVAIKSGAEAIHPGYGFLAEKAQFARACAEAGIIFIGPKPEAIDLMGDKATARRTAAAAGVPTVPGSPMGLLDSEMEAEAERIGYPLFIKAAAGGGGKGMRAIANIEDLRRLLPSARREAMTAFGDDTVYLERIVRPARHIEIQILADEFGNTIHLGERECSIQRRHQKLIEEAPSPFVDREMRQQMGEMAVKAAQSVGYTNAGTVEFIVDREKNFYFLEMNTRLQVEHPVTEMVYGVDIVKEQMRIASGRKLRYRQKDIKPNGWAMECRIAAEDPYNGFLPSIGRISTLAEPSGPGVRVESGIYEGFDVSLYYDPMLAKLIVWGETRGDVIMRMKRALREYRIVGVKTNIAFHMRMLENTNFLAGHFDTSFIDENLDIITEPREAFLEPAVAAAVLLAHQRRQKAIVIPTSNGEHGRNDWKATGRKEQLR